VNFRRVIRPFRGAVLHVKGIGEQANNHAEGQNHGCVQYGKKDASLEITDLVGQALPRTPKSL